MSKRKTHVQYILLVQINQCSISKQRSFWYEVNADGSLQYIEQEENLFLEEKLNNR